MTRRNASDSPSTLEHKAFVWLVVLLTIGVGWVIAPFYGAVFWGSVLALLFEPLFRRLQARFKGHDTLAALATLLIILFIVILPMTIVAVSLVQEVTAFYQRVKTGDVNFGRYFEQMIAALPSWAHNLLDRAGMADLATLQDKLTAAITQRGQALAGRAVDIGSETIDFIIAFCIAMYLLFFLLRDGAAVARHVRDAIPLEADVKAKLVERFVVVVRATVKGNVLMAITQGVLGGLAFWVLGVNAPLLWAVVMAFLSLLPAVGAALIWVPVALYLMATGQFWQGIGLTAFGVLVIGMVDNVLRPILVGKDTQMPDYVVLISTVGGIAVIGINGFVIGPLIVAMFMSGWELFTADRKARADAAT